MDEKEGIIIISVDFVRDSLKANNYPKYCYLNGLEFAEPPEDKRPHFDWETPVSNEDSPYEN